MKLFALLPLLFSLNAVASPCDTFLAEIKENGVWTDNTVGPTEAVAECQDNSNRSITACVVIAKSDPRNENYGPFLGFKIYFPPGVPKTWSDGQVFYTDVAKVSVSSSSIEAVNNTSKGFFGHVGRFGGAGGSKTNLTLNLNNGALNFNDYSTDESITLFPSWQLKQTQKMSCRILRAPPY